MDKNKKEKVEILEVKPRVPKVDILSNSLKKLGYAIIGFKINGDDSIEVKITPMK